MLSITNRSKLVKLVTYGAFLSFFVFGFVDNLKGPTLSALLDDLNFSYSFGGTIVMSAYLGFLIATLFTGALSDIAGQKAVIFVACACLFVGIIGYSFAGMFLILAVAMFVIGLGLGSLELGGNSIIVDLHHQGKGRYLNLLAFFHGVGSMVAPLYAGLLLTVGISWRNVYQSAILVVLLLFAYFLLVKYPKSDASESNKLDLKGLGKSAFTGEMILFYAVLAIYVAAEIGIGTWLVEFLQQSKFQSLAMSSFYLSLFFGMVTIGRLAGSFLVERIGYLKSMLYASLAAVVCVAIGTFAPASLAFFLPLTGLFFSIIFPTATAAATDLHKENVGTILGLLFTFAGVGGMFGPWLVGIFSDWVGIQLGFGLILIYCLSMSLIFGLLIVKQRRRSV